MLFLTLIASATLLSTHAPAQALGAPPQRGATPLEWSIRMADSQQARLGGHLSAKPDKKENLGYTTGLYADALIRLGEETNRPVYIRDGEKIVGSFISPKGKILNFKVKGIDPAFDPNDKSEYAHLSPFYSLDEFAAGPSIIRLYDLTHDNRYKLAADFLMDQLRHQPRTSDGGFWHKERYPYQMWLDGLYMAEPFYASYAKHFNEPGDFDDVALQFRVIAQHTYDPSTGLLYHGWDEKRKQAWANKHTGTSSCFWSRAIGWYTMALVDVLDDMPADHPARAFLIEDLNRVALGILKYQDPRTGVWWQVTDQGSRSGNYLEASASSMFVYALAKGVNHGYLPHSDIPAIRAGYAGIIRQFITVELDHKTVDLRQCCSVAGLDSKRLGTFAYYTKGEKIDSNDLKGVGPFINAGVECSKLFGHRTFEP